MIHPASHYALLSDLRRHVGASHLLTDQEQTARYRKGFRSGEGEALAVVFPGTLLELWRVLQTLVSADAPAATTTIGRW